MKHMEVNKRADGLHENPELMMAEDPNEHATEETDVTEETNEETHVGHPKVSPICHYKRYPEPQE